MTPKTEKPKHREFWVAETLHDNGLYIFRKNHEGGGLTKFVEYSAVTELEQQIKELQEEEKSLQRIAKDAVVAANNSLEAFTICDSKYVAECKKTSELEAENQKLREENKEFSSRFLQELRAPKLEAENQTLAAKLKVAEQETEEFKALVKHLTKKDTE